MYAPVTSAPVTDQLHQICVKACPTGDQAEFYRAIVCGSKLESYELRSDFAQIGLIHLLVVSGSHLVVLEVLTRFSILKRAPPAFRSAASLSILLLFTLMTLASPPVLRAFLNLLLKELNARYLLNWSRLQTTTIAGFLTLPFCRDAWSLCSLFLSWLAALALIPLSDDRQKTKSASHDKVASHLKQVPSKLRDAVFVNTKVYLALLFPLALISVPHPATIPMNVLFGPLLGLVLFPVSLLAILFPQLVPVVDAIWFYIRAGVHALAEFFPELGARLDFPKELVALELSVLTLAITLYKGFKRRKRLRAAQVRVIAMVIITVLLAPASDASASEQVSPPQTSTELIVWNVGQGSWATLVTTETCSHFDVGGEFAPWRQILESCRTKRNEVSISHWDLDHIAFALAASKRLKNFCLRHRPLGEAPTAARARVFESIPDCSDKSKLIKSVFDQADRMKTSNGRSQVFLSEGVLFPGDSGTHEERIWSQSRAVKNAAILIAGHHGSKTATSTQLLNALPQLRTVIVSSRIAKFGHPAQATRLRISKRRVPLLMTEDWGSLKLELSSAPRVQRADSSERKSQMLAGPTSASQCRVRGDGSCQAIR